MNNPRTDIHRAQKRRCLVVALGLIVTHAFAAHPASAQQPEVAVASKQHALLVGVTSYPQLGERYQLLGPANDVELVFRTLQANFGFRSDDVVALTEARGADDPQRLPTRENIEREFLRLAKQVRQGDQVVVFLAGHGSQQPAVIENGNREQDGLDEIFLPRDVGQWNGAAGQVERAISDNQIAAWIAAIRQHRASVWLIVDACHSGTLLRSVDERVRQVSAESPDGLNIPRSALAKAETIASKSGIDDTGQPSFDIANSSGVAAIYACQPDEVTVESTMPRGSQDAQHHGLLTFTLCKIMNQTALSGRPLTYKELARRVRAEYSVMGRRFPSPLAEGTDLDRQVLGTRLSDKDAGIVMLGPNRIDAGSLHGLTEGSVLSFASPAAGDKTIGHVEIVEVTPLGSEVEPCHYNNLPATSDIPADAVLQLVYLESDHEAVKIALDQVDRSGEPLTEETRRLWTQRIRPLAEGSVPVRIMEKFAAADWLLRPGIEGMYLVRAAEAVGNAKNARAAHFGPIPTGDRLADQLADNLRMISRAENLKRLAADAGGRYLSGRDAVSLDIDLRRCEGSQDDHGKFPVDWQQGDIELYDGDRIAIHVANPNRFAVDLNLFYIDCDYGITALYPVEGEFNRLAHNETTTIRCRLAASAAGAEHLVVIGVRAADQRVDLSSLAQTGVRRAEESQRSVEATSSEPPTPLTRLLQNALSPEPSTRSRGIRRDEIDGYVIELISWNIEDERRSRAE